MRRTTAPLLVLGFGLAVGAAPPYHPTAKTVEKPWDRVPLVDFQMPVEITGNYLNLPVDDSKPRSRVSIDGPDGKRRDILRRHLGIGGERVGRIAAAIAEHVLAACNGNHRRQSYHSRVSESEDVHAGHP